MFTLMLICRLMSSQAPCPQPHLTVGQFHARNDCVMAGVTIQLDMPDPPDIWTRFTCEMQGTDL